MIYSSSVRCLTLFVLLAAWPAWSQASNSTVRGIVRDQSNAVIPGATVTLVSTRTNISRTVVSNEAGVYVFPGVNPGPYRLTVDAAGMQRFEGTLTVQVQEDATVDAVLRVGQTASEVVVQDVTPVVRTDSPSIGHVLERKRIETLPINGRAITALCANRRHP